MHKRVRDHVVQAVERFDGVLCDKVDILDLGRVVVAARRKDGRVVLGQPELECC